MATSGEGVDILLVSNSPVARVQTSSSIRRVERLNQNVILFRPTQGTTVKISANVATTDIFVEGTSDSNDMLIGPDFAIYYGLGGPLGAAILRNASSTPTTVVCGGQSRVLTSGQRIAITTNVWLPLPGSDPPRGSFVVSPKMPADVLRQLSVLSDLPPMWLTTRSPDEEEKEEKEEEEATKSEQTEDSEMEEAVEVGATLQKGSQERQKPSAKEKSRKVRSTKMPNRMPCSGFWLSGQVDIFALPVDS